MYAKRVDNLIKIGSRSMARQQLTSVSFFIFGETQQIMRNETEQHPLFGSCASEKNHKKKIKCSCRKTKTQTNDKLA